MTLEHRPFLDQKMLAKRWLISHRTLESWRLKGLGPKPTKIGARVRYRLEDIEKFENAHLSKANFGVR